jgi:hypothetical protein
MDSNVTKQERGTLGTWMLIVGLILAAYPLSLVLIVLSHGRATEFLNRMGISTDAINSFYDPLLRLLGI